MPIKTYIYIQKSPLDFAGRVRLLVDAGDTIDQIFKTKSEHYKPGPVQPIAVIANRQDIPPDQWADYIISPGENLLVVARPYGIEWTAALIFEVVLAVVAVGSAVYAATLDYPEGLSDDAERSRTYNLDAQGNVARLGAPIPARYGRFRIYPDFASEPFREFIDDDQYLYQLFAIGQGSYSYSDLKIGDTPIENFEEITSQFYEAGQDVELFPTDVETSGDVSNIELYASNHDDYTGTPGPFVLNPIGTQAKSVSFDIVFPRGLNEIDSDGDVNPITVQITYRRREIDAAGDPVGNYVTLAVKTYTHATVDVLRKTERFTLPSSGTRRFECLCYRSNADINAIRVVDQTVWSSMRAELESIKTFPHMVWAIKAKATNNLSTLSERKFNGIFTRKLPSWNGSSWNADTATRNPAWAYADMLRSEYGGDYADGAIDLDAIRTLALTADARGDYFDGQFDKKTTLWEAAKAALASCRAYPLQYGEVFSLVRDDGTPANEYMFNGRNIRKDSLSVTYATMDHWGDDSVEVEYIDPSSWKPEQIICAIPGSPAIKPKKIKLFGVTDRVQANREGLFIAAKAAYRNIAADFSTELDARVPQYLDRLHVVQEVMTWGKGGEILNAAGQRLTLSEPVDFEGAGSHYIYLRQDNGAADGPYTAVEVAGNREAVDIIEAMPGYIYTGTAKEKTYFAFSSGENKTREMIVQKIESVGEFELKVQAVVDDPRVHEFDALVNDGTITTPEPQPPKAPISLTITSVQVIHGGTYESPEIRLVWNLVEGANRYFIEISYDAGGAWQRVATVTEPHVDLVVKRGTIDIRIAAQRNEIGAWYQLQTSAGNEFDLTPTPTALNLVAPFTGLSVSVDWTDDLTAISWLVEVRPKGSSQVNYSEVVAAPAFGFNITQAQAFGVGREFDIAVYGVNANNIRSVVPAVITVKNEQSATIGGVSAVSGVGFAALSWTPPADLDHKAVAIWASQTITFTPGPSTLITQDAGYSLFSFPIDGELTWFFKVAAYDQWGFDEINYALEVSATGEGVDAVAINIRLDDAETALGTLEGKFPVGTTDIQDDAITTPLILTDAVIADHILSNTITAEEIAALTITGGEISARTIEAVKLVANTITAGEIAAGTITATQIKGGTITGNEISAGSVTANEIDSRNLTIKDAAGNIILGVSDNLDYLNRVDNGPPSNAGVNSPTLGWRMNYESFTNPGAGEAYICGYDQGGNLADIDGFFYYKGNKQTIPAGPMYTGSSGLVWIVWDVARRKQFITNDNGSNGGVTDITCVGFDENTQIWNYDDNTGAREPIPTVDSNLVVIGACSIGTDNIFTGEMFSHGTALSTMGPPSPSRNTGEFSVLQGKVTQANAGTLFDTQIWGETYIDDLAVSTGKIKDLAVSTLKIDDIAVTMPASDYTLAGLELSGDQSIWREFMSIGGFTDSNGKTFIHYSFTHYNQPPNEGSNQTISFKLTYEPFWITTSLGPERDLGHSVSDVFLSSGSNSNVISGSFSHEADAGSLNGIYRMYYKASDGWLYNRSMLILGTRGK